MNMGPDDPQHPAEQEGRVSIREKKISAPLWQIAKYVERIVNNSDKREQDEKEYKKCNIRWMRLSVIFSAFFSLLSVSIAGLTFTVLTSQSTIQKNQLRAARIDQRAWVAIKFKPDEIEAGKPLRGTLKVVNTGKTLARKLSGIASLQIVASNKSPNPREGILKDTTFSGLLFPGDELLFHLTSKDNKSDLPLSKTNLEDLRSGRAYIAVLGKVGYEDIYDTPHWIKFCLWKDFAPGTYTAGECVSLNETDTD